MQNTPTHYLSIAVVVPVHNRIGHTINFLESFKNQYYSNYKVIIVNDGSTDNTDQTLALNYPDVVVLAGNGNLWWSGATNCGVMYALENKFDFILTINNDAVVAPDLLNRLLDFSTLFPDSVIGARINLLSEPRTVWATGMLLTAGMFPLLQQCHYLVSELELPDIHKPYFVDSLPGNGVLIPANCFRKIGLFDNINCPQYFGDCEFFLRAKKAGYKIIVNLSAVIWNDEKATSKCINPFSIKSPWYWRAVLKSHWRYPSVIKGLFGLASFFFFSFCCNVLKRIKDSVYKH